MSAIVIGKKYPNLKCEKCGKTCKEYSSYLLKEDEAKRAGLREGQRLCSNCLMDIPEDPKEIERVKKLYEKWEKEKQKAIAAGRKRAKDPKWLKKLGDRMMNGMMSGIGTLNSK